MTVNISHATKGEIKVVATINKEVITNYDLDIELKLFKIFNAKLINPKAGEKELKTFLIQRIIKERMQERYAKFVSISIDNDEFEDAIKTNPKIKEHLKSIRKNKEVIPYFKKQIRREMTWSKVVQRIILPQIKVQESEIEFLQKTQEKLSRGQIRQRLFETKINSLTLDIVEEMKKGSYIEVF